MHAAQDNYLLIFCQGRRLFCIFALGALWGIVEKPRRMFHLKSCIMQKIELIGNLGSDVNAEKFSEKGFVRFRLACSRGPRSAEEDANRTTWYTITAYVSSGVIPFLKKGVRVFVRGDLTAGTYVDRTGAVQVSLDVITRDCELCG